jgi:hypothetical protein
MKTLIAAALAVSLAAAPIQARAENGQIAAGILGGLAAGAIIGSAMRPPPPPVYYAPAPVYVAPPPPVYYAPAPTCYFAPGARSGTNGAACGSGRRFASAISAQRVGRVHFNPPP